MTSSLAIGDFARATHLSIKSLRNYHRLGLLEPAEVDEFSGYRRYTTDQIPTAQIIRRFRDLDMPLEQIGAVLSAPDLPARSELIARHLGRLEQELARTQSAVASLRGLLEGPARVPEIKHRHDPAVDAAAISGVVASDDLGPWFQGAIGELRAVLTAQEGGAAGAVEAGPPGAVIATEFFAQERGEITVYVPTSVPIRTVGRVIRLTIPAQELATIVHCGPHDDIDRSYGALATHVADRTLAVNGPIRERYLTFRHDTADETAWRTEIGWPIFDTGPTPA
jgi:DNA-binding transcriptional MerR regulator/effector-binding domain-containing protein